MKREFFFQDDRSNKFWTIEQVGNETITTNGRVGASPRETRKSFGSEEEAAQEVEKQIASKLKKGYQEGQPPGYEKPEWAGMEMSEDVFWRIIALFDWKKTGDDGAVTAPAVRVLSEMSEESIKTFYDLLAEKLFALDTKAHAMEIGEDAYNPDDKDAYFSSDWFLYTRCCVVANGREVFEDVLNNPENYPKDMEFEALLAIAPDAWEKKTGNEFEHSSDISYESFSNEAGWKGGGLGEFAAGRVGPAAHSSSRTAPGSP